MSDSQQKHRRRMVFASSAFILSVALGVAWVVERTRVERWDRARGGLVAGATTAAAYLDKQFEAIDLLASALLRHPAVRSFDEAASSQLFRDVVREHSLLSSARLVPTATGASAPDRPAASHANASLAGAMRHVGELADDQVTGRPAVTVEYAVIGGSGFRLGTLALTIDLMRLQGVLADLQLSSESVITVYDRAQRIVLRSVESSAFVGTTAQGIEPSGLPRSVWRTDVDGVERLSGDAPLKFAPWLLSVAEPRSVLTERLFPFWRQNLTFGGLALVGAVLLWWWHARLMAKQITQLEAAVQKISAGDLSTPTILDVRHRELARLQAAFVKMAASLRETRGALDRQLEHERTMNDTLQSLQRQVVRQERLTAVGLLTSGVAHELNNPLQAILGAATLLERQEELSSEARGEIDFVKAQSIRAREIIRSLARFSSSQSGPPSAILLRDVVSDVLALRARDLESPTLIVEIDDTSSQPVYANFTELEQVTLNFVLNAQQAVNDARSRGEKGRIQIRIFESGCRVRLEVSDNGPGVPLENESKLFQPFFTTKPVGQGTGLGLSVSYGIIQSYGGTIGYLRNAWGGATFFFELPALGAQARQEEPPETSRDAQALLRRPVQS